MATNRTRWEIRQDKNALKSGWSLGVVIEHTPKGFEYGESLLRGKGARAFVRETRMVAR